MAQPCRQLAQLGVLSQLDPPGQASQLWPVGTVLDQAGHLERLFAMQDHRLHEGEINGIPLAVGLARRPAAPWAHSVRGSACHEQQSAECHHEQKAGPAARGLRASWAKARHGRAGYGACLTGCS
jgi:hypothetical protein